MQWINVGHFLPKQNLFLVYHGKDNVFCDAWIIYNRI